MGRAAEPCLRRGTELHVTVRAGASSEKGKHLTLGALCAGPSRRRNSSSLFPRLRLGPGCLCCPEPSAGLPWSQPLKASAGFCMAVLLPGPTLCGRGQGTHKPVYNRALAVTRSL